MTYVDGFVTPVTTEGRAAYLDFTRRAWAMFRELGATSTWENWGDDVPEGQVTSFPRAVDLRPGEVVVFSWIAWPDKATRDRAMQVMMTEETMRKLGQMPFDGRRMIYGGFTTIFKDEVTT